MRIRKLFNDQWKFTSKEMETPMKTVRKSAGIGGYTSVLEGEKGEQVPISVGGRYFLNLISGGDVKRGLVILSGTDMGKTLEEWEDVSIPHDFKRELPFVNDMSLMMSGYKPNKEVYYRKVFSLEPEYEGKMISIYFEGVCRSASVWFNGCFLGDHYNGYNSFSFDLSDLARYGEEGDNVIFIKVDQTTGSEGWWYEGGGIYRDVYLEIKDKVHVKQWGAYIETKEITENTALLKHEVIVENKSYEKVVVTTQVVIYDSEGKIVKEENLGEKSIEGLDEKELSKEIQIKNPQLWSPEHPMLYKAEFKVIQDKKVIDVYEVVFGIREIKYTLEGLFVNGKFTEIKGVCEHQDFAVVGVALTKEIVRYKLEKMKKMGVNAYRSAHHPASKDLLDLCDEMGILVMDENRILESSDIRLQELENMVRRDRNHPCVFCWSLSNEEVIGSSKMAERMAKHMAKTVRKLDCTRFLVSAELLDSEGSMRDTYLEAFDVIGVNYPESPLNGAGLDSLKRKFPEKPMMSTENASYFSTRGIYTDDGSRCHTSNYGSVFSLVSTEPLPVDAPGAGGTAHPEHVMEFYKTHSFMGGSFLWTAFDYYGEPSPFQWPAISSQFGIIDLCGFEKDYYYYYQAKWTKEPVIHGMPHWNWTGREGEKIEIRVFSNCQEAEILLNGKSLGKKECEEHYTTWFPEYEPGTLEILGYKEGEIVAKDIKVTSGEAAKLELRKLNEKGPDFLFEIFATDIYGNEVPTAEHKIMVEIQGNGKLKGLANGDPGDQTLDKINERKLFSGKLLAVVFSEHPGEEILIKVKSEEIQGFERRVKC